MAALPTKNYTSYTEPQWTTHSQQSRRGPTYYTHMKALIYTISLCFNYVVYGLNSLAQTLLNSVGIQHKSRWMWWNPIIIDNGNGATLYVGALPLIQKFFGKTIRNDAEILARLGIKSVLSATEPFENNMQGLFLSAVTPQTWDSKQIKHLQIATPDFQAVSLEKIHEGVEFIHWNMQAGRSVYVHCKAGRGRSVLIALCYLMKYHQMSRQDAFTLLKSQRNQASLRADKLAAAEKYERSLKEARS